MGWTPDRDARALAMWSNGESASVIAADLCEGLTRSAVMGHINRSTGSIAEAARAAHGGARLVKYAPLACDPFVNEPPPPTQRPVEPVMIANDTAEGRLKPEPPQVECTIEWVALLDAARHNCRWPIGDPSEEGFRFCGRNSGDNGGPYCKFHASRAYNPLGIRNLLVNQPTKVRKRMS